MSALSALALEDPFFRLGPDFYDEVKPAQVKAPRLRFKSPGVLSRLGVDPGVSDEELVRHFGAFAPLPGRRHGPLAQRYIGFQFRVYNPHLGDGRGFLFAQARARDGALLDLGTKGSGTTPYSRGGDGMLTLKGGVRELIAAEFLHAMGVKTSRPLTLVEHDAKLYRGDEPSPTRASILVRVGEGHIRFGSFERAFYLTRDPAKAEALLTALAEHAIECYYPKLKPLPAPSRYQELFREVVLRSARLVAYWMRAGFCHGVLNTDNMNIAGDSFDYGPYAFVGGYDPGFTAAYFDAEGLYAFERQPDAVFWNLQMLARPFGVIAPEAALAEALSEFAPRYRDELRRAMLPRLGFEDRGGAACRELLEATFALLRAGGFSYHGFFLALTSAAESRGLAEAPLCPEEVFGSAHELREIYARWRGAFLARLAEEPAGPGLAAEVAARMRRNNPRHVPLRPEIERVWEAIDARDDWAPLSEWLAKLSQPFET